MSKLAVVDVDILIWGLLNKPYDFQKFNAMVHHSLRDMGIYFASKDDYQAFRLVRNAAYHDKCNGNAQKLIDLIMATNLQCNGRDYAMIDMNKSIPKYMTTVKI